jgi:hypothetical protein
MHGNNNNNRSVKQSLPQSSKNAMFFLLSLMFSLQQSWRRKGWNRFCLEVGVKRWPNNVSKCKNYKIKNKNVWLKKLYIPNHFIEVLMQNSEVPLEKYCISLHFTVSCEGTDLKQIAIAWAKFILNTLALTIMESSVLLSKCCHLPISFFSRLRSFILFLLIQKVQFCVTVFSICFHLSLTFPPIAVCG